MFWFEDILLLFFFIQFHCVFFFLFQYGHTEKYEHKQQQKSKPKQKTYNNNKQQVYVRRLFFFILQYFIPFAASTRTDSLCDSPRHENVCSWFIFFSFLGSVVLTTDTHIVQNPKCQVHLCMCFNAILFPRVEIQKRNQRNTTKLQTFNYNKMLEHNN